VNENDPTTISAGDTNGAGADQLVHGDVWMTVTDVRTGQETKGVPVLGRLKTAISQENMTMILVERMRGGVMDQKERGMTSASEDVIHERENQGAGKDRP